MKRHPSLVPYSSDHHRILVLAQLLKKSAPAYKGLPVDFMGKKQYALEQFESLLKPHEVREEKHLFPNIKNYNQEIDQLIDLLQGEHLLIETGFRKMKRADFGVEEMNQLGHQLENHVRTEERSLFELVQSSLPSGQLDALGSSG